MDEILTIRVPRGTRRKIARLARARGVTVSQYVRRAIEAEGAVSALQAARADLVPKARAQGIYTDEDVFTIVS
jgi:predicted transcriptional regulator